MSAFVGIDVSKASLDIAVREGTESRHFQVENTPNGYEKLDQKLQGITPIERIALEASGRYGEAVALFLVAKGYQVSYLNPKVTHRFAQSSLRYNKTDAQDAHHIAHYAQLHRPDLWQPPSAAQRLLTQRSRRLETLKKMRQQERNRLASGMDDAFIEHQIQQVINYLETLIDATQKAIHQLIRQDAALKHNYELLLSIQGIGQVTATLFLSELGDISRFESVKQLTAFVGLDAQDWQSGSSVKRPAHISKHGNSRLRAGLYMPALTAIKHNTACRLLNQRLALRDKPGKIRVVAVMRKLLHQIYGVLKHQSVFDDSYEFHQQFA